MPWLRNKLVFRQKFGCYGEVGYHGTHGHQNCCLGLKHMGNGGFDRETGQECLWPVHMAVTLHGRGKNFTQVFL